MVLNFINEIEKHKKNAILSENEIIKGVRESIENDFSSIIFFNLTVFKNGKINQIVKIKPNVQYNSFIERVIS